MPSASRRQLCAGTRASPVKRNSLHERFHDFLLFVNLLGCAASLYATEIKVPGQIYSPNQVLTHAVRVAAKRREGLWLEQANIQNGSMFGRLDVQFCKEII